MGELLVCSKREGWNLGGGEGSRKRATVPSANAETDANTNAGRFPPPNSASHGPLPIDTII